MDGESAFTTRHLAMGNHRHLVEAASYWRRRFHSVQVVVISAQACTRTHHRVPEGWITRNCHDRSCTSVLDQDILTSTDWKIALCVNPKAGLCYWYVRVKGWKTWITYKGRDRRRHFVVTSLLLSWMTWKCKRASLRFTRIVLKWFATYSQNTWNEFTYYLLSLAPRFRGSEWRKPLLILISFYEMEQAVAEWLLSMIWWIKMRMICLFVIK